jgi:hypothetical protein
MPAALAAALALSGCGRNDDGVKVQRAVAARATPSPTPAPTPATTATAAVAVATQRTTQGLALESDFIPGARRVQVFGHKGAVGMPSPDEVRLYAIDTSGSTVLEGCRGTVQMDAVGTAPVPMKLSPNSLYLFAKLPVAPKLPVGARFQLFDKNGKWNSTGAFIERVSTMPYDPDESQMPEFYAAKRGFEASFGTSVTAIQAALGAKDYAGSARLATQMAEEAEAMVSRFPGMHPPAVAAAARGLRDAATSMTVAAEGDGSLAAPLFKEFREQAKGFLWRKQKD